MRTPYLDESLEALGEQARRFASQTDIHIQPADFVKFRDLSLRLIAPHLEEAGAAGAHAERPAEMRHAAAHAREVLAKEPAFSVESSSIFSGTTSRSQTGE